MSSLKKECRNYYQNSVRSPCVPVEVPLLDFSELDKELARLEQQEANTNQAEADALDALLAARAKKDCLRKQRKVLKRRKQQQVNKSRKFVEDIIALEAINTVNQEIGLLEDSIMPSTLALNQSAFMPSVLKVDLGFNKAFGASRTAQASVGNS